MIKINRKVCEVMKDIKLNPKPMFYACVLEGLRKIAKENGYALAIHGSCASDLDLIAVRWNDTFSTPNELAKCFINELSNYAFDKSEFEELTTPEHRYKNQIHYTIPIIADWYIDLTVIED
ncbi:MAG: hypothetical protein IJB83_02575 [Bacilli bacterium]|nr:hypothetical protein [Bacilli bacterium]